MEEVGSENRRLFRRIPFNSVATLRSNGRVWPVQVEDLSLNGALVTSKLAAQIDIHGEVTLFLPLSESAVIEMKGIVAHTDGNNIGLKCQQLDLNSVNHLRRLMELNLGNVAMMEREFRALVEHLRFEGDCPASESFENYPSGLPATESPKNVEPTNNEETLAVTDSNRRQFHRVPFITIASIHSDELNLPVELLDLSLKGALFRVLSDSTVPFNTELKLHIILSNDVYIEMTGKVVHQDSDIDGFECTSIDLDSARHLVRLVELNLGDPDLMERELATLSANQHWA